MTEAKQIHKMRVEIMKDSLRMAVRERMNVLIASGISDHDAELAAIDAICSLSFDLMSEWAERPAR